MAKIDPKQIKQGKLSGNYQVAGNLQIDGEISPTSVVSDTTSLTALILSATNKVRKRPLGSMALASLNDYYTNSENDNRYLRLTGGSLSGTLDLPNINITQALRINGVLGGMGQIIKSNGTSIQWDWVGWNEIANKPSFFDGNYNSLINKPALFDGNYNSLINKPSFFDGNYNSLSNQPLWLIGPDQYYSQKQFSFYQMNIDFLNLTTGITINTLNTIPTGSISGADELMVCHGGQNAYKFKISLTQLKIALNNIQLT